MTVRMAEQVGDDHYRFTRIRHRTDAGRRLAETHATAIEARLARGQTLGRATRVRERRLSYSRLSSSGRRKTA